MTDPTVDQINAAHQRYITAGRDALEHAITAGELLIKARKAVKKNKGDWLEWLAANCPDISDRTDRLYRRLAKNEKEIKTAAATNGNGVAEFSVRGAARLIAKPRKPRPPKPPQDPPQQQGQDIHTVLQCYEPVHLHAALKKDWKPEQIKELGDLIHGAADNGGHGRDLIVVNTVN